jgi:hypothetical protein
MARKRVIDMDDLCFDTEIVSMLGAEGVILYQRLWSIAEDWGGYEPKYKDIALKMGAFNLSSKKVEAFIRKLIDAKKIVEYEIRGKKVHWIVNFLKRQTLNNPGAPELPLPEWIKCEIKLRGKFKKKTASYTIVHGMVPVPYQYDTGMVPVLAEAAEKDVDCDSEKDKKRTLTGKGERGKPEKPDQETEKATETKTGTETETAPVTVEFLKTVPGWDPEGLRRTYEDCQGKGVILTRTQILNLAKLNPEARSDVIKAHIAIEKKKTGQGPVAGTGGVQTGAGSG